MIVFRNKAISISKEKIEKPHNQNKNKRSFNKTMERLNYGKIIMLIF